MVQKNMKESKLDKELKETIDNYYNKLAEKEIIDKQLKELKDNKFDISNEREKRCCFRR